MKIQDLDIIAHFDIPGGHGTRDGRAIVVDRGPCELGRYVAAVQYRGDFAGDSGPWDEHWDQGDYCETLGDAWKAMGAKVVRYRIL